LNSTTPGDGDIRTPVIINRPQDGWRVFSTAPETTRAHPRIGRWGCKRGPVLLLAGCWTL